MPDIYAYLGLFTAAFGAATLLPLQSEALLVALLLGGGQAAGMLVLVASLGNVLGSLVNWWLGRYLERFRDRRWFPVSDRRLLQAQHWYGRYGRWSLLLSWLPVIGDPLTLVAGIMREPLWRFMLIVTLAKTLRYTVLAAATLGLGR
ncbi:YqaA family protein [Pseudomonas sp. WHRI 8822A]|uniref:YqaA family protein n=1 Tax=Pseudomonas sp. WHRI 8822A TaxID=3162568 RepID=UPI0032F0458B